MNDIQENKLSMYNKTGEYLDEHVTDLAGIPAIAAQEALFDTARANILDHNEEAVEDTTGFAIDKNLKITAVIAAILRACAAVESHGVATNDFPLQKKMNYNKSELEKLRDMELLGVANLVYKTTDPLIASLAAYLYLPADLVVFDTARNAYNDVVTKPKEMIEGKETAGMLVDELFVVADTILDKIDVFMKNFRYAPDGLYFEYLLARKIDNNNGPGGGGGEEFSGTVPAMNNVIVEPVVYNPASPVMLENTGTVTLFFELLFNGFGNANFKQVNPGASDTFLMGEWNTNGNQIRVSNNSGSEGSYTITIG